MATVPVAAALLYLYLAQHHGVYTYVYGTVIMFRLLGGLDRVVWYREETAKVTVMPL